MDMTVDTLAEPFRLLADPVRLRILRVLRSERLNVSELTRVLGIAQSGVSRHVGLLRDAGFLEDRREGGWTWLSMAEKPPDGLEEVWPGLRARLGQPGEGNGDDARLAEILRERWERRVGWGGEPQRSLLRPGRSWSAWARALGHLLPASRVADLGCGDGALALEIARWASEVVGVDSAKDALTRARAAARRQGVRNVRWKEGSLMALPLPDAAFDVALLSQVLHAEEEPAAAVGEAVRVTRGGGRVLVLDLLPHREAWVRERLDHRHLGFPAEQVATWLSDAGLSDVRAEPTPRRRGNPFTVVVASGRRPAARARSRR
jgi:ArsR family transcriptional regulator